MSLSFCQLCENLGAYLLATAAVLSNASEEPVQAIIYVCGNCICSAELSTAAVADFVVEEKLKETYLA
ncbi:MAG: hypothetical protein ACU0FH_08200 [Heliomarina sp.]|uniref:hypothetical protein n=1 Tax=Heliomarina sp. TaxID=2917556 RepID=UPI004058945D